MKGKIAVLEKRKKKKKAGKSCSEGITEFPRTTSKGVLRDFNKNEGCVCSTK